MREDGRRAALGLGLVGVVAALTLVIVRRCDGYDGNATDVDPGVPATRAARAGTADAGSIKIDNAQLVSGYNDGRISIPRRGGDPTHSTG